jgi:hypothetical protein
VAMPLDPTARQRMLKELWESHGPHDVLRTMTSNREVRAPELADEILVLAEESSRFNSVLSSTLVQVATFLRHVHNLAGHLARVDNLGDLYAWYKTSDFTFLRGLACVMGAMMKDAERSGEVEYANRLRRGLGTRSELVGLLRLASRLPGADGKQIMDTLDSNPELCRPAFHDWLRRRANAHGISDGSAVLALADALAQTVKYRQTIQRMASATPGSTVMGYLSPDAAASWHRALPPDVLEEFGRIADKVCRSQVTLDSAIDHALCAMQARVRCAGGTAEETTYFLENLLQEAPSSIIPDVLRAYEQAVDNPELRTLDPRILATNVLHFASALIRSWRLISEPELTLRKVTDQIYAVLPTLDIDRSPRLVSDLRFVKARAHENLGSWDAKEYQQARLDYEAGLEVEATKTEREARGRALADLANTLQRIPWADPIERDRRILEGYEEADRCLDGFRWSHAVALVSHTVYLNERALGDWRQNQERALEKAKRAVEIVEKELTGNLPSYRIEVIEAVYLTYGNIVRAQPFGLSKARLEAARDAYQKGLKATSAEGFDHLRGILRLNLAQTYRQLSLFGGRDIDLQNAELSMSEAEQLLGADPNSASMLRLQRAEFAIRSGASDVDPVDVRAAVTEAQAALDGFMLAGEPRWIARAHDTVAHTLSWSAPDRSKEELEAASIHFAAAVTSWLSLGDLDATIESLYRLTAVHVALFRQTGDKKHLIEAKGNLLHAARLADDLWKKSESVGWRTDLSDVVGLIHADLAWCRAELSEPVGEVFHEAERSKGSQLASELAALARTTNGKRSASIGNYFDRLREGGRRLETAIQSFGLGEGADTIGSFVNGEAAMARLSLERALVEGDIGDQGGALSAKRRLDLLSVRWPNTSILDITVGRFGIVLVVGRTDTPVVRVIQSDRDAIPKCLVAASDWFTHYRRYRQSGPPSRDKERGCWAEATDRMLTEVERTIRVLSEHIDSDLRGIDLLIVPGALAGLPIHATKVGHDEPLCELFRRTFYVPTLSPLGKPPMVWKRPMKALCILCDAGTPERQLLHAPQEVLDVSASLVSDGVEVVVIASVGDDSGAKIFCDRGLAIPVGVRVLEGRPTGDWLRANLAQYDHVFYSGHGHADGLVLVDEHGREKVLTALEISGFPALTARPAVVLSACESAHEDGVATTELFSVASCLIRIGAGCVVGTLWLVRDRVAADFSRSFYRELPKTHDPIQALRVAIIALRIPSPSKTKLHAVDWGAFIALEGA